MFLPDSFVEKLIFRSWVDVDSLSSQYNIAPNSLNYGGKFEEINWLNTPGPIYTTFTDNCGIGQIEAINNVGGNYDYHEIIFKQPVNLKELRETIVAAIIDPFGGYYFDGNQNWTKKHIIEWWNKSTERVNYIVDLYAKEIGLPSKPHVSNWKIGDRIFSGQLYGPDRPVPENYKAWLDFYQLGMKHYLEWYTAKVQQAQIILPPFVYDWTKKEKLDKLHQLKFPHNFRVKS